MRKIVPIMVAALAVAGCSAGADRSKAEAGVALFHEMVEAGRYQEIYTGAADEFRRTASQAEGIRFLRTVHDRLGPVRSSASTSWRVNFTPGGSMVSLSYNTQFASGSGTEDFVFRIGGATAQLVGYHVNVPRVIGSNEPGPAESPKPSAEPAPPPSVTAVPPEPEPEPEPEGGK